MFFNNFDDHPSYIYLGVSPPPGLFATLKSQSMQLIQNVSHNLNGYNYHFIASFKKTCLNSLYQSWLAQEMYFDRLISLANRRCLAIQVSARFKLAFNFDFRLSTNLHGPALTCVDFSRLFKRKSAQVRHRSPNEAQR